MKVSEALLIVVTISVIACIVVGSFKLYRYVNWKFAYSDMVEQTIQHSVKPECLKKGVAYEQ